MSVFKPQTVNKLNKILRSDIYFYNLKKTQKFIDYYNNFVVNVNIYHIICTPILNKTGERLQNPTYYFLVNKFYRCILKHTGAHFILDEKGEVDGERI